MKFSVKTYFNMRISNLWSTFEKRPVYSEITNGCHQTRIALHEVIEIHDCCKLWRLLSIMLVNIIYWHKNRIVRVLCVFLPQTGPGKRHDSYLLPSNNNSKNHILMTSSRVLHVNTQGSRKALSGPVKNDKQFYPKIYVNK